MSFQIVNNSVFDIPSDAFTNSINCCGVMGAGIALEFKKRYPLMFEDYKEKCSKKLIRPGDCYTYFDHGNDVWLLGLAVKDDWRHWSTYEWIERSLASLKITLLQNEIKSVNLPLLGGKNGKRGPYGKVQGMTDPPDREELKEIIEYELGRFADQFQITINLCLPDEAKPIIKPVETLDTFFTV